MSRKYDDYRDRIYLLDKKIENATDKDAKIALIDENIQLNQEYIAALKKPIPAKIVLCVILSIIYLIGLMIFLPQIIIRKNRIKACERRIFFLEDLKKELQMQE